MIYQTGPRQSEVAYRARNRSRARASKEVNRAIGEGRLVRPSTCSSCGLARGQIAASVQDFARPLASIRWLCRSCLRLGCSG